MYTRAKETRNTSLIAGEEVVNSSSGERKRLVQALIIFSLNVNYVHQSKRDRKYESYCWQGSG